MNRSIIFCLLLAASAFGAATELTAQGTAFLYQGRLNDSGAPAGAAYDFRFVLYDAATNGHAISLPLTNSAIAVSNGLFAVTLDFGAGVFTGTNYWLDLGVRAAGTNNFTALTPRQPVLPVPYAVFANSASNLLGTLAASQLTGTLPSAQVAGNYTGAVNYSNPTNSFTGTFTGVFTGNGASLTNLNGAQIASGTVADARLTTNVALLTRNQTFTSTNIFAGANFFTNATNFFNGAFAGNGAALTNLNGTQLTFGTVADARLTTNVALLNRNQTFTGANTFIGVNTLTNWGNTFVGNFSGNGLVQWVPVSGIATQAVRDTGYLLLNPGLTTVTLPLAANLQTGDIIRISGAGAGGWLAAPNSGQSILGNFACYRNGYLVPLPVTGLQSGSDCHDIAASADGTRRFTVGNFPGVYASSDSGQTWSQTTSVLAGSYYSIACSANGRIIYIAPSGGGTIQKSTDGGLTWAATAGSGSSVACNADGSIYFTGTIACSGNGTYVAQISSGISVSTNGGSTWFSIPAPFGTPSCLAVSSDCTRLVAGVSGGLLYASANQGASWTTLTTTNQYWSGAWMSADGGKFAAAVRKVGSTDGGIFSASISTQPNTVSTSPICGSQGSAVELQFIGSNLFMPVSATGLLWAN